MFRLNSGIFEIFFRDFGIQFRDSIFDFRDFGGGVMFATCASNLSP